MKRFTLCLAVLLTAGCESRSEVATFCTFDAGVAANVPLRIEAQVLNACEDGRCEVTVDGGSIRLEASARRCSGGTQPVVFFEYVWCEVPALAPGTYAIEGQSGSLEVAATNAATTCALR